MPEDQHPQLPVGRLVHGLGLHAHLVLLGRQLVYAALLMPEVEEAPHGRPHHDEVAVQVLAVKVHVLATPAFDVQVEPTCGREHTAEHAAGGPLIRASTGRCVESRSISGRSPRPAK